MEKQVNDENMKTVTGGSSQGAGKKDKDASMPVLASAVPSHYNVDNVVDERSHGAEKTQPDTNARLDSYTK